ncbi:hypothetical protein [Streptomyces sp. NPDC020607]|uniref:hypothetical protein n=1 Tax=Streptomyces sp. NPDC020607 TaxID=3365082 RepID=UPI00378DE8A2
MAVTHAQVLEKAIRSLGGTWDTARAAQTLRDAGRGSGDRRQQEKRARQALRDSARSGLIEKTHPSRAIYRAHER